MKKEELGNLVCYLWSNIDQAACIDNAEKAFRNCLNKIQLELLDSFVKAAESFPEDWTDKSEYVIEAIEMANKLLGRKNSGG